jgi:hypothetical protein
MAFKMRGTSMNGKSSFTTKRGKLTSAPVKKFKMPGVTLNPATRDDPQGITIGNPEDLTGATVDNETLQDLNRKYNASRTDMMMFEDLTNRLKEYENDPYRVEVLSQGEKLTNADYKDWLKRNDKQLKKDGYNKREAERLFNQKINESRNIDNDLRLSAEKGRGFTDSELAEFGVYGDEGEYTPDPGKASNIERNMEKLGIAKQLKVGDDRMNRIRENIEKGRDISTGDVSWLASRAARFDLPQFNQFLYDVVMPYEQLRNIGSNKQVAKNKDKLQNLLDSGKSIEQAYAELNITPPSTEGKTIAFSDDPRASKMGGELLRKFSDERFGPERFLFDARTGADGPGIGFGLDVNAGVDDEEYSDEFTSMMDEDIAGQVKQPVEQVETKEDVGQVETEEPVVVENTIQDLENKKKKVQYNKQNFDEWKKQNQQGRLETDYDYQKRFKEEANSNTQFIDNDITMKQKEEEQGYSYTPQTQRT